MKIEALERVLENKWIDLEPRNSNPPVFDREFKFTVKESGSFYKIIWWKNQCYLHAECGAFVMFDYVKLSSTWPNRSNMNLQFYNNPKDPVCVIPLEKMVKNEN